MKRTDTIASNSPFMPSRVWLMQHEINGFKTLVQSSGHDTGDVEYVRADEVKSLVTALRAVTNVAGNLTDEAVEAVGGINDARSRALMVVNARQIARAALEQI